MKSVFLKYHWLIIAIASLLLLFAHVFQIGLLVDNTTLVLFMIFLASPLVTELKRIKVGDFEAEIERDVDKIKEKIEASRSLRDEEEDRIADDSSEEYEQLKSVAESDPAWALAKIRMEIENSINAIYRLQSNSVDEKVPLMRKIIGLRDRQIIDSNIASALSDVIAICNKAIHGAKIKKDTAREVVDLGIDMLEELRFTLNYFSPEPDEVAPIDSAIVDKHLGAEYVIKTIIPYVENPVRREFRLTQEGLDSFLQNYNEYAEFIIDIHIKGDSLLYLL